MMGYQGEGELVLHIVQKEGHEFLYTTCTDDSDYYKIECEGLTNKEIAYNLWNLEDSILVVKTPKGERGWLRFVYGNSWGELVADYTVNIFPNEVTPEGRYYNPLNYMDWDIEDVTEVFGLGRITLCDLMVDYKPEVTA